MAGDTSLIVVSGGRAHPFRTEYAEAVEMKKELIQEYNILENGEPYTSHTTTNLRNASRLLMKYDLPIDQWISN